MSATTFLRWQIMMELEPSLEDVMPVLSAQIAQAVWNVQIAKSKSKTNPNPKLKALKDFFLRFGDTPAPADKEAGPAQNKEIGRSRFNRLADHFASWGLKPVKKD